MGTSVTKRLLGIFCLFLVGVVISELSCRKSASPQDNRGPQVVRTGTGIEMVAIPGGWFEMGSKDGASDEKPVHRVWIDPFLMDRFEVIQEEFRKYQLPDPSHFKGPKRPLEQINWTDATLYCNERSRAEGLEPCYDEENWQCNLQANGYRLPTEAEWEYACRAGTSTKYSFGNNVRNIEAHAWFAETSAGATHPVGQKKPNPWGLYDMHGNVAEWCHDYYAQDYYKQSPQRNPQGPTKGKERVLRGGAWNSGADSCRSSYRASDPSINDTCLASDAIGFRCVRNAPNNPSAGPNPNENNPGQGQAKTGFVYDDIYLGHKVTPGHPEMPERLTAIVDRLKGTGLYPQLHQFSPKPADLEWITVVHSRQYAEHAKKSCQDNTGYLDSMDTPISAKSYEVALVAAGGVLCAIDAVMQKKVRNVFCAVRPPGHHAMSDRAMGFCLFNHVAIGTRYVQKKHNLPKVLIVDWDVHHGNGTQAAFYDDPSVLYFSVHQYPFYPGTGSAAEKGTGKGLNSTINVPLPAGSTDADYLKVFEEKLKPAALAFAPEFVLISAGFDAHEDDLLGGMRVTTQGFARLSRIVKDIAEKCCEGRLVSVLEGGYELDALAASVEAHIRVLME